MPADAAERDTSAGQSGHPQREGIGRDQWQGGAVRRPNCAAIPGAMSQGQTRAEVR